MDWSHAGHEGCLCFPAMLIELGRPQAHRFPQEALEGDPAVKCIAKLAAEGKWWRDRRRNRGRELLLERADKAADWEPWVLTSVGGS